MIEKKGKDYKESLSKAGKDSAIQLFLKLSGYKVSSPDHRKNKKNLNLYLDDLSPLNDNLVIVKVYETSIDENIKKELENKNQKKQTTLTKKQEKINFYHNINLSNDKNKSNDDDGPPCTKYTPKFTSIHPRLITGPFWKTITGRKYKKIERDIKDYLITHDSIIDNEKKSLVNMNKDTQRGTYLGINDVRIRTDKKFDYKLNFKLRKKLAKLVKNKENKTQKDDKSENKIKNNKDLKLSISISDIFKDKNPKKNKSKTKKKNDISDNKQENNKDILQTKSSKKLFPSKTLQAQDKEKEIENYDMHPRKHMRTIDFTKILSREKREKALAKKKLVDIIRNPDHSPLYERPKIFKYHTIQSPIPKKFTGFKSYLNYDPNKAYKIRVVHPLDKVPNFNLILPRPEENKNLPSFMQKMFNRNDEYNFNDTALKLNGYSEQKLGKTMTSFFPKKSFNNIVNMNMMTGKMFEDDYKIDDLNDKKNEIKNRMKIKNKNLGKLIKEGALKRFDNFSLRTFHKTKNIMVGDLNKYLLGLRES